MSAKVGTATGPAVRVRRVDVVDAALIDALATVMIDVVAGGASIGFMNALARADAVAFWQRIAADVHAGRRLLIVADDAAGVCGTTQVVIDMPPNQPHRGDLAKMMVAPSVRNRGIGGLLLAAAEREARAAGKTLLVLDTASDAAVRVYERGGWIKVGVVPDYALLPDGGLCDTVLYYRRL